MMSQLFYDLTDAFWRKWKWIWWSLISPYCKYNFRWGLMTITTVGNDLHPKTLLGKLIGGFCALSGVVFINYLPHWFLIFASWHVIHVHYFRFSSSLCRSPSSSTASLASTRTGSGGMRCSSTSYFSLEICFLYLWLFSDGRDSWSRSHPPVHNHQSR